MASEQSRDARWQAIFDIVYASLFVQYIRLQFPNGFDLPSDSLEIRSFANRCVEAAQFAADGSYGPKSIEPGLAEATRALVLYLNTKIDPKPAELQNLIVAAESALSRSLP